MNNVNCRNPPNRKVEDSPAVNPGICGEHIRTRRPEAVSGVIDLHPVHAGVVRAEVTDTANVRGRKDGWVATRGLWRTKGD